MSSFLFFVLFVCFMFFLLICDDNHRIQVIVDTGARFLYHSHSVVDRHSTLSGDPQTEKTSVTSPWLRLMLCSRGRLLSHVVWFVNLFCGLMYLY